MRDTIDRDTGEVIADEDARSFAVFLSGLGFGQAHADLSHELQKLGQAIRTLWIDRGGKHKGELNLKINILCDEHGQLQVGYEIKRKDPAGHAPVSIYWLTPGGNITAENPRQPNLPGVIREVSNPNQEVRRV